VPSIAGYCGAAPWADHSRRGDDATAMSGAAFRELAFVMHDLLSQRGALRRAVAGERRCAAE
jgi:hypothetical protein